MTTTTLPLPSTPDRRVPAAIALWIVVALALSLSGVLTPATMPLVPLSIGSLFAASVVAHLRIDAVRAFARAIDLRIPIAYHAIRIPFGAAFLVMGAAGTLDPAFATRAGWGDVLAGSLAIAAVISLTVAPRARALPWIFGVVGLIDMAVVIATAQWTLFFSGHPETMAAFQSFPFSTIPFFVVPMILATHVLVIARLRAAAGELAPRSGRDRAQRLS